MAEKCGAQNDRRTLAMPVNPPFLAHFPSPPPTHTAVPRRYLGRGKDAKGIDGGVGGKAEALPFRGNDRGHKGAVADRVVELVLVGPVGALVDVSEEGVVLVNSCG